MDYDILNSAVEDIIYIVNQYNADKNYDESLCKKLVLALFGYYIAFGPEIFKKISTVLDALKVKQCPDRKSLIEFKRYLSSDDSNPEPNPGMVWQHSYDHNNKFIGSTPIVFFAVEGLITDVFILGHELSHCLEGTSAKVIEENAEEVKIKQGMAIYVYNKETNRYKHEGHGMTELVTIVIENKILREYLKLDPQQLTNPLVKDFVGQLKTYQGKSILLNSYSIMSGLFRDLITNEQFFEMVKRNYYDNNQEGLIAEFDSLDNQLSLGKLRMYADKVIYEDFNEVMYYTTPIQKQMSILNKKTGVKPDNKILIIV